MNIEKYQASKLAGNGKIKEIVNKATALRLDPEKSTDISFADMVMAEHELEIDDFYANIGIDPAFDTIHNLFTTPDSDARWLLPEIIRDSLRLGYRAAPIWPNITAAEEQTSGLTQILPHVNMSDASPKRVGEGETIPVGTLSYGHKTFSIHKFGRGIKLTDEVTRYVNLNVLSIYLQDFGIKMGQGVDVLAINTLINGEQSDGSEAAPVIGVATPNTLAFRDILKIWIKMSKIGRMPRTFVGSEDMALDTMDLNEFKMSANAAAAEYKLNVKMPLPQGADYYIHGNVPANQQLIVDPSAALIKLNAVPLVIESERMVANQTEAFYASFTLGFAKLFMDACLIQDVSQDFATAGFPEQMDVDPLLNVIME